MNTAAILLGITIIGGALMAILRIQKKIAPPTWFAVLHGVVAAVGLIVFMVALKQETAPDIAMAALMGFMVAAFGGSGLFVLYFTIAALGGVALFFIYHMKKKELPIPLIVIHATMAAISLITLIVVY